TQSNGNTGFIAQPYLRHKVLGPRFFLPLSANRNHQNRREFFLEYRSGSLKSVASSRLSELTRRPFVFLASNFTRRVQGLTRDLSTRVSKRTTRAVYGAGSVRVFHLGRWRVQSRLYQLFRGGRTALAFESFSNPCRPLSVAGLADDEHLALGLVRCLIDF